MPFARSTYPFIQGCAMAAQLTRMWYSSQHRRNFFLVNCVPLSVVMEFGAPKRWMMSRKNIMACSDLIVEIGPSLYPLCELVYGDKQVGIAPGRSFEMSN